MGCWMMNCKGFGRNQSSHSCLEGLIKATKPSVGLYDYREAFSLSSFGGETADGPVLRISVFEAVRLARLQFQFLFCVEANQAMCKVNGLVSVPP
jgi:hypothetical protein